VHNISDVKQTEIYTAEPSVPGPSRLAKFKKYKSLDSAKIPAELIQAEGETLLSAIQKVIISSWKKEMA
jgi:hypothetical protein